MEQDAPNKGTDKKLAEPEPASGGYREWLNGQVQKCILAAGLIEQLTPFQERVLAPLCQGKNVMARASAGRGKTTAMVIGVLHRIAAQGLDSVQAIIIVSCLELARQVNSVVQRVGAHMGIKAHMLVGGVNPHEQVKVLYEEEIHVVIATPGRLDRAIKRQALDPERVRMIVLDDADEIVARGYNDVLQDIFTALPSDLQLGISTTLPLNFPDPFMTQSVLVNDSFT